MLSKLRRFVREQHLICPGDTVVCAVSGGADSMALLWALYLLKEEWSLELSAAHFNHRLRGEESDRDEAFVREFCRGYGIPLHVGSAPVTAGKKGLEAAAREARYAYLNSLPGKIATAHTADDNAETVLLHLVRGTGLKGLGGIMPRNGRIIRPLLSATRAEVEAFLAEYAVAHIEDSSNSTDAFLRNRLRHDVMPLLKRENPRISENLSAMALRLRQDEEALEALSQYEQPLSVTSLRRFSPALRARALERFLKEAGVKDPEAAHIKQAEALVFSNNPSSHARFPGGITVARNYDTLEKRADAPGLLPVTVICREAAELCNTDKIFTVIPRGKVFIRPRQSGDAIRLSGGTRSLKKLFIDRKIPASARDSIPILCDDGGILGVYGIGVNLDRAAKELPATRIELKL